MDMILLLFFGVLGLSAAGNGLCWLSGRRATKEIVRLTQEMVKMTDSTRVLADRLGAHDTQLSLMGQVVLPISTVFRNVLVKELTHFHTPATDALLAKIDVLTPDEEAELLRLLAQREQDMGHRISASEREAAHMLPLIMKRAKAEARALVGAEAQFRMVSMVSPVSDTTEDGPRQAGSSS